MVKTPFFFICKLYKYNHLVNQPDFHGASILVVALLMRFLKIILSKNICKGVSENLADVPLLAFTCLLSNAYTLHRENVGFFQGQE